MFHLKLLIKNDPWFVLYDDIILNLRGSFLFKLFVFIGKGVIKEWRYGVENVTMYRSKGKRGQTNHKIWR